MSRTTVRGEHVVCIVLTDLLSDLLSDLLTLSSLSTLSVVRSSKERTGAHLDCVQPEELTTNHQDH